MALSPRERIDMTVKEIMEKQIRESDYASIDEVKKIISLVASDILTRIESTDLFADLDSDDWRVQKVCDIKSDYNL